ncbi:hypothetical protein L7F22_009067 [Adiantum nelumboides]|nr:hypothetical protein [Adiantum nelumboides]
MTCVDDSHDNASRSFTDMPLPMSDSLSHGTSCVDVIARETDACEPCLAMLIDTESVDELDFREQRRDVLFYDVSDMFEDDSVLQTPMYDHGESAMIADSASDLDVLSRELLSVGVMSTTLAHEGIAHGGEQEVDTLLHVWLDATSGSDARTVLDTGVSLVEHDSSKRLPLLRRLPEFDRHLEPVGICEHCCCSSFFRLHAHLPLSGRMLGGKKHDDPEVHIQAFEQYAELKHILEEEWGEYFPHRLKEAARKCEKYVQKIKELTRRLNETPSEKRMMAWFLNGFNSKKLKEQEVPAPTKKFTELVHRALELEQQAKKEKHRHKASSSDSSTSQSSEAEKTSTSVSKSKEESKKKKKKGNWSRKIDEISKKISEISGLRGASGKCGKYEHFAAQCPKPKKSVAVEAKQPELVPVRAGTSCTVVIEELPNDTSVPSKLNPKAKEWDQQRSSWKEKGKAKEFDEWKEQREQAAKITEKLDKKKPKVPECSEARTIQRILVAITEALLLGTQNINGNALPVDSFDDSSSSGNEQDEIEVKMCQRIEKLTIELEDLRELGPKRPKLVLKELEPPKQLGPLEMGKAITIDESLEQPSAQQPNEGSSFDTDNDLSRNPLSLKNTDWRHYNNK